MNIYDDDIREYDYEDDNDLPEDEDGENLAGYTVIDDHSIFGKYVSEKEEDEETIATPIPVNESTVILSEPQVAGLTDGKELKLKFEFEYCYVMSGNKKVGSLKPAFVAKLRNERGRQLVRAYYKADVPPMVRLVFGDGAEIPPAF